MGVTVVGDEVQMWGMEVTGLGLGDRGGGEGKG